MLFRSGPHRPLLHARHPARWKAGFVLPVLFGLQDVKKEPTFARWLPIFFAPGLIGCILAARNSRPIYELHGLTVNAWLIPSSIYLLIASLIYNRRDGRRGCDLVGASLAMTLGFVAANILLAGTVAFAGCVCALSKL